MTELSVSRRLAACSALLCATTFIGTNTYAKTPEPPGLFSTVPGNPQAQLPEKAIANRSRAVTVNRAQLRKGRFFISLPDGVSMDAVRDQQQELGPGQFAWVGHAEGDRRNRVVIGVSGESVAATFAYQGRLFKLEPRRNGSHVVSEVEATDPAPEMDPIPIADQQGSATTDSGSAAAADGSATIDVLVAYTPAIQSIYGTEGAQALIIQAVAEANQAYANSGINPRLNLVHTVQTNYTESGSMNTDLSRLRSNGDGYMDEIHSLRDTYGADLVSLIEDEPQYCGLAYRMATLSASFSAHAFSVVHRTCATGYYSFAHELGHNQGAHHDPLNASGAIYPYAYGYQEPYGAFRTVMAYNCSGGCTRVDHFSNTVATYNGQATGAGNISDNALALNNTTATVAAFRGQTTQSPPSAPSQLAANATSHSTVSLAWTDTSADESSFELERSTDAVNFSQIASLPVNTTSFQDDSLSADTLYHYRVRARNGVGSSSYSGIASAVTEAAPAYTDQLASADIAAAGSVSGTYQNTWLDDGIHQTIQERQSGGKRSRRYGYLEHKWTFSVQPGNSILLSAEVAATTASDSFTFAYSTDNASYVNMFSVDAANSGSRQFVLPSSLSGTVYIRVRDNVRNQGESTSHTVQVDHLLIRTENQAGDPPAAPANLLATSSGATAITVDWVDMSGDEYGFGLERRQDGSNQWAQVATMGTDATSYTDTQLLADTLFHYRVKAFNGAGQSAFSNLSSAQTDPAPAGNIDLSAQGYKVKGVQRADLTWTGATGSAVDIYRDGSLIAASIANNGSHTDNLNRKGGGSYTYQVCEAGSENCSNSVNVVF